MQYTAETNTISISANEMIVNLIVVAVIIVVMLIIYKKLTKQITSLLLVCTIALCGMGKMCIRDSKYVNNFIFHFKNS